jgi:hypothetical protein
MLNRVLRPCNRELELEVDKGICLVGSKEYDRQYARPRNRYPLKMGTALKQIFVSRRLEKKVQHEQR